MVQEKIADSYAAIRMLRLFVLETAWKIDNTNTQATRTDIAAVKYTMAKVLREVVVQRAAYPRLVGHHEPHAVAGDVHGAPTMGIADGVDEVHKATVARNVLKNYRPHEGYWPTEYFPAKREQRVEEVRTAVPSRPGTPHHGRGLREVHRSPWLTAARAQTFLVTALKRGVWRWGESNPRLPNSWWDFSERSRWEISPSRPVNGTLSVRPASF